MKNRKIPKGWRRGRNAIAPKPKAPPVVKAAETTTEAPHSGVFRETLPTITVAPVVERPADVVSTDAEKDEKDSPKKGKGKKEKVEEKKEGENVELLVLEEGRHGDDE